MPIADTATYLADIVAILKAHWPDNRTVNIVCHAEKVRYTRLLCVCASRKLLPIRPWTATDWILAWPHWKQKSITSGKHRSKVSCCCRPRPIGKLIPIVPVWEVQEGQMAHSLRRFGRETVVTVSELE